MSSTTPNMLLEIPTPEVTLGPDWAQLIVDALERIDEHDHTTGLGVALSSQSLTVDADLSLQGYNLTGIRTLRLNTQGSTPATADDLQIVYSLGGELYYRDDGGNAVQITNNGSLAGTSGSIANLGVGGSSASYNNTTKTFTWLHTSAKAARMANADIDLYPYDGTNSYTNNVTLKVNTTLSADYNFILPDALPGSTSVMTLNSTGQVATTRDLSVDTVAATSTTVTTAYVGNGAVGTPSLAFTSDTDTGMWRIAAGEIAMSSNGTQSMQIGSDIYILNGRTLIVQDGSASAPSVRFLNDLNTGIYSAAADVIGMAANGSQVLELSTASLRTVNGSAGAPGLSFLGDPTSGFYRSSGTEVQVAVNGNNAARFSTSGLELFGNLTTTGSIETASGGAFKVKIVSNSWTTNSNVAVGHGLTYTKIRGVSYILDYQGVGWLGTGTAFVTECAIDASNITLALATSSSGTAYFTIHYVD